MTTHMLRNQADLRHIQAILGHTILRSTQIYTHSDIEDLKGVISALNPHGKRGMLPSVTSGSKMDKELGETEAG